MKKFLVSIMLVSIMLITLVIPASAADGNLSVNASLSADKTSFVVDVVVKNNPGVIALTAEAIYDTKVLKLTKVENGKIFEDITQVGPLTKSPNKSIWMDAFAPENITTNGVLVTYTFEVLKNAPSGESEIKFAITDIVTVDDSSVKFTDCSFRINVKENSDKNTSQNGGQTQSQTNPSVSSSIVDSNSANTSSNNVATNNQTLDVEKPLVDNTLSDEKTESGDVTNENTVSSDDSANNTIGAITESDTDVEIDMEQDSITENEDGNDGATQKDKGNSTLITLLIIGGILVVGGGVACVAIYFRKKSSKNN